MTLFYILSNDFPFQDDKMEVLFEKIKVGKFDFRGEAWEIVSPEARDLISSMLQVDPHLRLSAAEVLEHPWFAMLD